MTYKISDLIKDERGRRGWNQADLARHIGDVGQQTVSRWESGSSRPERKTISRLAAVLELDVDELLRSAGYCSTTSESPQDLEPPVRPLVSRLPLDKLTYEQFEQFMHDLVNMEEADRGINVHRFGTQGEKQYGIDLIVKRGQKTLATVQCKRRKRFGPAAIRAAVNAVEVKADMHYIALTRPASPDARLEMENHPRWVLRDIDDISQAVRSLPKDQGVKLVDTYFCGWREDFLGVRAPSPWLTTEEFFQSDNRATLYSHKWALVGRRDVIERIDSYMAGVDQAALVVGRGGIGKTRILFEVGKNTDRKKGTEVRILGVGIEVRSEDFELLPQASRLLIMMDDVHERADVDYLLAGIWRARPNAKILLVVRPYGLTQLNHQLASAGLSSLEIPTIELDDLSIEEAESLACEVLGSSINRAAYRSIANISRDCPLITVVAAGLLKRGSLNLSQIDSDEEIRAQILLKFRDSIVAGAYGGNADLGNAVLAGIALLQPFRVDDKSFQTALEEITTVSFDRVMPHVRSFQEAGVLLRRGNCLRVIPDMLGDVILSQVCFDEQSGASIGFIERSYEAIKGAPLQNAFVNTSRIDWQIRKERRGVASPVEQLWADVIADFKQGDILGRKRILQLAERAAYFMPERALELVCWAVDNPIDKVESEIDGFGFYKYTYQDVLQELPSILRLIAYNFDYLEEACNILWTLAQKDDRRPNQYPDHPLRVLTELAEYGQGKPVVYIERVLDVAETWFPKLGSRPCPWSPFDVLEPILATEGADQYSSGKTISFSPFGIKATAVEKLRDRVTDIALSEARNNDLGRAVRAIKAIASGLSYPHGAWGRKPDENERKMWSPQFVKTMTSLQSVASDDTLDPVVSVAIRQAVSWHAYYSTGKVKSAARKVLEVLPSTLEDEMALLLADIWDLLRNPEQDYRKAESQLRERMNACAGALTQTSSDKQIVGILEKRLEAQVKAFGRDHGNPGALVWALVRTRPSVGIAICNSVISHPESVLVGVLSVCLGQLLDDTPESAMDAIEQLLGLDSLPITRSIAQAFGWQRGSRMSILSGEPELLERLAAHPDPNTRKSVIVAARLTADSVSECGKDIAIGIITNTRFADSTTVAEEVFSALGPHGNIRWRDIPARDADKILKQLLHCPSIDEHSITEFLSELSKSSPRRVIRLLKERVQFNERASRDVEYRALPYRWHNKLQIRDSNDFKAIISDLLEWIAEGSSWQRREMGADLFRAAAISYDEQVLKVLDEPMRIGSKDIVDAVATVLSAAPGSFVFENTDWVRILLRQAAARSDDCLKRLNGALFRSAISNEDNGVWGRWPWSAKQLAECHEIAEQFEPGSVEYRFYKSLEQFCDETIRSDAVEDEMLFDDREW